MADKLTKLKKAELIQMVKDLQGPESLQQPEQVYQYIQTNLPIDEQEYFSVIFMNTNNEVIGHETLFKGGMAATVVDVKILLKKVLATKYCTTAIITHNHPSGNMKPSQMDDRITKKISKAFNALEIRLLDHIIYSKDKHYSYSANGYQF